MCEYEQQKISMDFKIYIYSIFKSFSICNHIFMYFLVHLNSLVVQIFKVFVNLKGDKNRLHNNYTSIFKCLMQF